MYIPLILALAFRCCFSVAYRTPSPPVNAWPNITPEDQVVAAKKLLLSLLGSTTSNVVLNTMMPSNVDPCTLKKPNNQLGSYNQPGFCGASEGLCKWSWLTCRGGNITAIKLSCDITCSAPLFGAFPDEGPNLPYLQRLDVSTNPDLKGQLSLSNWKPLPDLMFLNLSGCGFRGQLPDSWKAVSSLQVLDLSSNRFSGTLPVGFSDMRDLTFLLLGGNADLSGYLPSSWDSLGQLIQLDVRKACRLCGSTASIPNLFENGTFVEGSHVNTRCRIEDCDNGWRGLHNVFQGVMAAFASVLGLTALVLVLRRVRHCTNARANARESARLGHGLTVVNGGHVADRSEVRSSRRQRRRRLNYTAMVHSGLQSVPLYTVEFDSDGGAKWSVELVGYPNSGAGAGGHSPRRQSAGQPLPEADRSAAEQEVDRERGTVGGAGSQLEGVEDGNNQLQVLESRTTRIGAAAGLLAVPGGTRSEGDGLEGVALGTGRVRGMEVASITAHGDLRAPVVLPRGEGGGGAADGGEHEGRWLPSRSNSTAHATGINGNSDGPTNGPVPGAVAVNVPGSDPEDRLGVMTDGHLANNATTIASTAATAVPASGVSSQRLTALMKTLPHPPDAVILMPDGVEFCLGRRVPGSEAAPSCNPSSSARNEEAVVGGGGGQELRAVGEVEGAGGPGTGAGAMTGWGPQGCSTQSAANEATALSSSCEGSHRSPEADVRNSS